MKHSISKGEMREYSELLFIKMTISKNAVFPERLSNRLFLLHWRAQKLATTKQWWALQGHYKKLIQDKKNKLQICDRADECGMSEGCTESEPHYKNKGCPDGIITCKSESYKTGKSFWATCRPYTELFLELI